MAIYTRFGSRVEIQDYIGKDTGRNSFQETFTDEWVYVKYVEDGHIRECAVSDLRADEGIAEINAVIAPFKRSSQQTS